VIHGDPDRKLKRLKDLREDCLYATA